jgi:PUA domain protein
MKLKNRHHLRSDEIKELEEKIEENYGEKYIHKIFSSNSTVEIAEMEDEYLIYIIDGDFLLIETEKDLIPSLKAILNEKLDLKKVVVDMGAIKYVVNGADVMRPGIVEIDSNIKKDSYIKVVEETYSKALAIGIALYDSDTMKSMEKGKVVKNIHYINDKIWNFLES